MKLERLEGLKLINTKNVIVNEVMSNLERKAFYSTFEIQTNVALVYATLFGNTEMHKEMAKEDIDWIAFVNEVCPMVEEIKNTEYANDHEEVMLELYDCVEQKRDHNNSFSGLVEEMGKLFTQENLQKIKDEMTKKGE